MHAEKPNLKEIVLHINDLVITEPYIVNFDASTTETKTFDANQYDNVTDKWTIRTTNVIPTDRDITLTVSFKGFLKDGMYGFYRSYYYKKRSNEKIWMASTQFQSTDARRAFPCFDVSTRSDSIKKALLTFSFQEPGFKAQFKVTINRLRSMIALSNTEIETSSEITVNGVLRTKDEFRVTPKMSTYLLAFIVADYDGLRNDTLTKFGVYARPEAKNQTALAVEFGKDMLKKLGDYIGIDYYSVENVSKMDMAAIPDFSAGG